MHKPRHNPAMTVPFTSVRSTRWALALAAQWSGAIVSAAISIALLVWLARTMDAREFVRYSSTLSGALVALALIEGGWNALIYREHAGRHDAHTLPGLRAAALAHAFSVSLLSMCALWVVTRELRLAFGAALCMLTVALMNHRSVLLRSQRRFATEAGWQVLGRMLSAVVIIAAVLQLGGDADWVFLAWACALGIILIASVRQWGTALSFAEAKRWYPQAIMLLIADACFMALLKGDLVWLSTSAQWRVPVAPESVLKNYAVCVRWVEGALMLIAPLTNVVVARLRADRIAESRRPFTEPTESRYIVGVTLGAPDASTIAVPRASATGVTPTIHSSGLIWADWSKHTARLVLKGAAACAAFGALCWVAAWVGGEAVVTAAFGTPYVGAGAWLPVVALPLPMACANLVMFQAVLAVARGKDLARAVAVGLLSFVVAAILLLFMNYGAVGMAVAAAFGQSVLLFCLIRIFNRQRPAPNGPQQF